MGVNLNNLSISLDQFNKVSSGDYNIGQLKLSSDGASVYRTNNHKTWTIFNNTKISTAESLAIKFAFCKALASEGLSVDEMTAIKAKLGIPGSEGDALKAGNIKPLSAAEVREIIDEYAGKINENRAAKANGAEALKTSADIYKGVDKKELQSRAEIRDSRNAGTLEKGIASNANKTLNTLMDILRFSDSGKIDKPSRDMINLAKDIRSVLKHNRDILLKAGDSVTLKSQPITLVRGDDAKISIKLTLDDGNTLSFSTNLDKSDLHGAMGDVEAMKYAPRTEPQKADKADDKLLDTIDEVFQDGEGLIDDSAEVNKRLMGDLAKKLTLCRNSVKFDAAVKARMSKAELPAATLAALKREIKDPNELERKKTEMLEVTVKSKLRSTMVDSIVEPLQKALKKARPLDEENVKIVNRVRDAMHGDNGISDDAVNALQRVISGVLNQQPVSDEDKIAAGLKAPSAKVEEPAVAVENNARIEEDDGFENLNINDLLGGK